MRSIFDRRKPHVDIRTIQPIPGIGTALKAHVTRLLGPESAKNVFEAWDKAKALEDGQKQPSGTNDKGL
jgi:hypothetical protein